MTRLFLHFWNVSATFKISQKEPVSQICVVPFSNFGSWITFGPPWIRRLFYIWTTLLITVHTFAVVIISFHIRKYAICYLFHLAWLNSKRLAFTLFTSFHKGWTAALVRSHSLLLWSGLPDVRFVKGPNLAPKRAKREPNSKTRHQKRANHFFQIYQQLQRHMNPYLAI